MEFINKAEICGIIGTVRIQTVGDTKVAQMSVATDKIMKGKEGDIIQTTWHNVTAWQNHCEGDIEKLGKGDRLHIFGEIADRTYCDMNGNERHFTTIMANRIVKIEE